MRVIPVPCLRDNYAYLIASDAGQQAAVVDPGEAEPVIAALEREGLTLAAILCTHHHPDHVGGNSALLARDPTLRVFGHESDRGRVPGQTDYVVHRMEFELLGLRYGVLHIPGHTTGAVAYVVEGCVFTGDTLFAAGCGRLFEGTPAMMHDSLNVRLAALPDETRVYFGHEYTENNLRFAAHVEPGNADVHERARTAGELRARGEFTTPSTLALERATNPFMRCSSPEIRSRMAARLPSSPSDVDVLAAVRAEKDSF